MSKYLFLFSISPVQSFISQARKTRDLFAGSILLSNFVKEQINFLKSKEPEVEVIFPNNVQSKSLPNRFVVKISAESGRHISELGRALQENFQEILEKEFDKLSQKVAIGSNKDIYFKQVSNTFDTYWAAIELKDNYKECYLTLEKIHAAAKNIKRFKQIKEQGRKCSLCGERNAYFYGDKKVPVFIDENSAIKIHNSNNSNIMFTKKEALCTVCAIKRFQEVRFPSIAEIALRDTIPESDFKKIHENTELFYDENLTKRFFEKNNISKERLQEIKKTRNEILNARDLKSSQLPKYYALIMFDGDNMGKLLAGEYLRDKSKLEEFHKSLSEALSENAENAKDIVDRCGKTVYAGGDDFLGFVSLKNLMPTLKELREEFKKTVNGKLSDMVNQEITMSAGIAIAHYKTPLKTVLDWARTMEKEAKEFGGRDAFAIAVLKHSGEIHKTVWKWFDEEKSNIERIEAILKKLIEKKEVILKKLIEKKFSANFIYTLEEEFSKLTYKENPFYAKQFEVELKRLIAKSLIFNENKDAEKKELYGLCKSFFVQMGEIKYKTDNYFALMRIIDFISRQLGGKI